jgi:hypothetical protein
MRLRYQQIGLKDKEILSNETFRDFHPLSNHFPGGRTMKLQLELTFDSPRFESMDKALIRAIHTSPIAYAIKVPTNRTERQGNCFY